MKDQVTERALKIAKDRRGWNQVAFAKALDVDKANVTNWLARGMPAAQHIRVAKLLKISVEELLGGTPPLPLSTDRLASSRIAEPTVTQWGITVSEGGFLFAAEWEKLNEPVKSQISALVHAIVNDQVLTGRKKPGKGSADDRPSA